MTDYMRENFPHLTLDLCLKVYLEDCTERVEGKTIAPAALYISFCDWAKAHGRSGGNLATFKSYARRLGLTSRKGHYQHIQIKES